MSMRPGRYKGVRTPRPIEVAHGRASLDTEGTEAYDTIDLVLEGQAALILAVHWMLNHAALADANDDLYDWRALLTMDEDFNVTGLETNWSTHLDDEQVFDVFQFNFQNVITTSGQTILPGKSEWHEMPGEGLLVPESVRLAAIIADGGSVGVPIDVMVYYKRIEKPTPEMKDYFYRRR